MGEAISQFESVLLDLYKVADALGCSYEHARTLCAKGKLPFVNIGTGERVVYRVRSDDLEKFMSDARRASTRSELANVRTTLAAFDSMIERRW